ncbi:MAG: xanthine dehydrogenase family protein molybdopterin-binding subunit [Betaproteobacteria bacterium]|nr:xanthine dehydrogenase family protein molybdopterin-binding subunit [Betaproteobacteria bacterium]
MTTKIGDRLARVEDDKLLRGRGRFVDDIRFPDMLHAAFVRSPLAHARLRGLDVGAARALPGVHAVFTYADIRAVTVTDRIPASLPSGMIRFHVDPPFLAHGEVCYFGEPLAVVIADSRRVAEDAARLVEPDLEPLPAVVDPRRGVAADSPKARLECPDNLVAQAAIKYGDVDAAFARAPVRIAECFSLEKGGGHSIEARGVVAHHDALEDRLTVWDSTQMPHRIRALLVAALGLAESQVRVVAPDVGGGFGPKAIVHPEELVIPVAAMLLGRPVKWVEDRYESFAATVHERMQIWDVEAAASAEGRLLAIRGKLYHDHGASTPYGVALPYNAATNLVGPYALPAFQLDIALCLTNMVSASSTRGAGRPQGTFVMERLLDRIAAKLGLARDEVRRRNLIQPGQMPYTTPIVQRDGQAMTYDSGDYPEAQRRALEAAGWADFPARQAAARQEGRWIGIGLANYVEATGRGPFESASVRIGVSGKVVVTTGATAQGQGVKTMLTQLVASALSVAPASIEVIDGDTSASPLGLGAFASRQAVTAGSAAFLAAREVVDKAKQAAAAMMEVAVDDLDLRDGEVVVKGVSQMKRSLKEIAQALAGNPGFAMPGNLPPGLAAAVDFQPAALTYNNGSHVVEAEVDIETGAVKLNRYVILHDCGRMINPTMVEGQVLGAVVHGIGATLFEWMRYDENGQPLTGTYADYLLPTADVLPRFEILHMETPTPLNPLGVKGAGESGTIGAPAAIVAAIEDALAPLGVTIRELPVTPARLQRLIQAARARSDVDPVRPGAQADAKAAS